MTTDTTNAAVADEPKAKRARKAAPAKAKKAAKKAKAKRAPRVANGESRSVIPLEIAKSYTRTKDKEGKVRIDNNDEVANTLRNKDLDAVYALVAKKADVTEKDLRSKYAHLNVGMQRMNLGNKLRGILNAA